MKASLSVIIPAFNEQDTIDECIKRVVNANILDLALELIIIDDGSTDKTFIRAQKALSTHRKKRKKITSKILRTERNSGKGVALKKGILASKGDLVIIQDADLEYNPADYPALLEPFMSDEADVVYGSRFITDRPHRVLYFWHFVGNTFITLVSNALTNLNLTDIYTGYKAFKGELIRSMASNLNSSGFEIEAEITKKLARVDQIRFFEVGVSYSGRTFEQGKKIRWWNAFFGIWKLLTA